MLILYLTSNVYNSMAKAIIIHRDAQGIWYGDLYFPFAKDTLQSPITGKLIANKHKLSFDELIKAHLTKLELDGVEIVPKRLWWTYVKYRKDLKMPYEVFMNNQLQTVANEGYSPTLLTFPAPFE